MNKRVMDSLVLKDEDFVFNGDLTIKGVVDLTNANLIVSGKLEFLGIPNVNLVKGDISCQSLHSNPDICINDGDIYIADSLYCNDIITTGEIEVYGDSCVSDIHCLNYLVNGNNDSTSICALQDIYILGNNDSYDLCARDILIGGNCDVHNYVVSAKNFFCVKEVENLNNLFIK